MPSCFAPAGIQDQMQMSVEAEHTIPLSTKGVTHVVEQAWQAVRLSSAENVDPPSQSEQTVSLLVVHAETMPLPVVQVVHAVHAVASATAENVVPSWQAIQTLHPHPPGDALARRTGGAGFAGHVAAHG